MKTLVKNKESKTSSEFLSEPIVKLLNYRIEQEEFSSRLYHAMSLWLTNVGYQGAGRMFKKFGAEELLHADKAKIMLVSNGIQPTTPALKRPKQDYEGLPNIIEVAYEHEKEVTQQCYALTQAAQEEGNFMVMDLGLWYCREQREELEKFQKLIDRLEAFGTGLEMLRDLDNEMGAM